MQSFLRPATGPCESSVPQKSLAQTSPHGRFARARRRKRPQAALPQSQASSVLAREVIQVHRRRAQRHNTPLCVCGICSVLAGVTPQCAYDSILLMLECSSCSFSPHPPAFVPGALHRRLPGSTAPPDNTASTAGRHSQTAALQHRQAAPPAREHASQHRWTASPDRNARQHQWTAPPTEPPDSTTRAKNAKSSPSSRSSGSSRLRRSSSQNIRSVLHCFVLKFQCKKNCFEMRPKISKHCSCVLKR